MSAVGCAASRARRAGLQQNMSQQPATNYPIMAYQKTGGQDTGKSDAIHNTSQYSQVHGVERALLLAKLLLHHLALHRHADRAPDRARRLAEHRQVRGAAAAAHRAAAAVEQRQVHAVLVGHLHVCGGQVEMEANTLSKRAECTTKHRLWRFRSLYICTSRWPLMLHYQSVNVFKLQSEQKSSLPHSP